METQTYETIVTHVRALTRDQLIAALGLDPFDEEVQGAARLTAITQADRHRLRAQVIELDLQIEHLHAGYWRLLSMMFDPWLDQGELLAEAAALEAMLEAARNGGVS